MAEVLLTHAVNEAEEAIESGNYGGAIETCQRILGQFPEFAGAHRIMADAYAEQGDTESARQAYQRTLERDPQSIPAHLGLGIIAEDAGDRESALAYFQVAWEIDPRRRDLREHVSRVSQQLYGSDGRLYLTRAALASLHFHAGRWDRAVSEAAQVLQEFPTRIDVQVRLAEALWRRGDDEQSRQVCRSILRSLPSSVVPLLILADIHRHEGDEPAANDFLRQARDIDPDGVRAADLIMVGLDDQADFLAVDSIPTIDDQIVHEEPARYAPAPDFMSSEPESPAPVQPEQDDIEIAPAASDVSDEALLNTSDVQPFRWEDIGDEDLEVSDLDASAEPFDSDSALPSEFSLPTDEEIERARPSDQHPSGYTSMLESLDSEGMQPFDPGSSQDAPGSAQPEQASSSSDDVLDEASMPTDEEIDRARPRDERERGYTDVLDSLESEGMQPFDPVSGEQEVPETAEQDLTTEIGMVPGQLPSDEEIEQARPGDDRQRGHTEMFGSLDAEGMQPFDPFADEQQAQEPAAEAMSQDTGDEVLDLSLPSDDELEGARPEAERPSGFTGMLDELEAEGVQPFDFADQAQDVEVPAETEDPEAAGAPDQALPADAEPFDLDWSRIDEEIEEAIPGEMPRGYTDELRDLDDFGLEPFDFSDANEAEESTTDAAAVEPEPVEPVSFDDDVDLDQLAAGWNFDAEGTGDQLSEPELPGDEFASIDVVFEGEDTEQFPETEQLRPDAGDEPGLDLTDSEFGELGDLSPEDSSTLDEGLDQLLADVEAVGANWPASEPARDSQIDELFADTMDAIHQLGGENTEPAETEPARFVASGVTADRLGLDEALIERARQTKQRLIEQGRITGSLQFPGVGVSLETLQHAVEADPFDIDSRIALASALVDEHPDDALEQFRWVYRNAPERGPEVVDDLVRLIVVMREREVGVHRLLGALYRRHGDWLAAATHYEESLIGKRRPSAG